MSDRRLSDSLRRTDSISVPESFFTEVVPKTRDTAELKVVLYVAYLILQKPESTHLVTYRELKAESRRLSAELDEETLRQALDAAAKHGILLHSTQDMNGVLEDVYSLTIGGLQPPTLNIFTLYEQNIGLITPLIAEELREAEKTYPPRWIAEAFKEAVALNKRSWRYIARILERWASEGKDSGEYQRDAKKDSPDKYVKGKYGHLVQR